MENYTLKLEVDERSILRRAEVNGKVIDYVIDPSGRRVGKKISGVLAEGYIYKDQLNPVAKVNAQGSVLQSYTYLDKSHVPAFMEANGKLYRYITDQLGSVIAVMDTATGLFIQKLTYDAFGKVLSDTNPGFQPFGFAGGLYDQDTKLVRFGARDYNPETGRWMQKDPIGFAGGDTNLYRYAANDPVNKIDPNGMDWRSFVSRTKRNFNMTNDAYGVGLSTSLNAIGLPPVSPIDALVAGGVATTATGAKLAGYAATFGSNTIPLAAQQVAAAKFVALGAYATGATVFAFEVGVGIGSAIEAIPELFKSSSQSNSCGGK